MTYARNYLDKLTLIVLEEYLKEVIRHKEVEGQGLLIVIIQSLNTMTIYLVAITKWIFIVPGKIFTLAKNRILIPCYNFINMKIRKMEYANL